MKTGTPGYCQLYPLRAPFSWRPWNKLQTKSHAGPVKTHARHSVSFVAVRVQHKYDSCANLEILCRL